MNDAVNGPRPSGPRPRSRFLRVAGAILIATGLVAAWALMYLPNVLSETAGSPFGSFREWNAIATAIARESKGEVRVGAEWRLASKGSTLTIKVFNSSRFASLSGDAVEEEARRLALLARSLLADAGRYHRIQVVVGSRIGTSFASIRSTRTFSFEASELADTPAVSPAPPSGR